MIYAAKAMAAAAAILLRQLTAILYEESHDQAGRTVISAVRAMNSPGWNKLIEYRTVLDRAVLVLDELVAMPIPGER